MEGAPALTKAFPRSLCSQGRACGLLAVPVRAPCLGPLFSGTVQGRTETAEMKRGYAPLGGSPHPRVWDGFVFTVWLGGEGLPRGSHRSAQHPVKSLQERQAENKAAVGVRRPNTELSCWMGSFN